MRNEPRRDKHLTLRIHRRSAGADVYEILGYTVSIGFCTLREETAERYVLEDGDGALLTFRRDGAWGSDYHKVWFLTKEEAPDAQLS